MANNYKNINLNLFDQNVLGNFKVDKLSDGSIRLIRHVSEEPGPVKIETLCPDYNGTQRFFLKVGRENRAIDCCVVIVRTSENCYIVAGANQINSYYMRCANVSEVSNFLKNNFCRTLLSGEKK